MTGHVNLVVYLSLMKKIEEGTKVNHRSNPSIEMIVTEFNDTTGQLKCSWIDGNGKPIEHWFKIFEVEQYPFSEISFGYRDRSRYEI